MAAPDRHGWCWEREPGATIHEEANRIPIKEETGGRNVPEGRVTGQREAPDTASRFKSIGSVIQIMELERDREHKKRQRVREGGREGEKEERERQ